jgi:hypothetical protein
LQDWEWSILYHAERDLKHAKKISNVKGNWRVEKHLLKWHRKTCKVTHIYQRYGMKLSINLEKPAQPRENLTPLGEEVGKQGRTL